MLAPQSGLTIAAGRSVALAAIIRDQAPDHIAEVDFLLDGQVLASASQPLISAGTAPLVTALYLSSFAPTELGSHTLAAEIVYTDTASVVSPSASLNVVDPAVRPPARTFHIVSFNNGATLAAGKQVTVTVEVVAAEHTRRFAETADAPPPYILAFERRKSLS